MSTSRSLSKTATVVTASLVLVASLLVGTARAATSRYRILELRLSDGRTYGLQIDRTAVHVQRPLIILLPGLGETETTLDSDAHAYGFGRSHGITIAFGHQLRDRGGTLSWNAGGCCALAAADDVGSLRQLVATVDEWSMGRL